MTREIKFRAWDKRNKEWLLGYEMPNLGGFSMFGEVMMMGEYASLLSSRFPDDIKEIELMQFTGLHDKNGKEIYEGDILQSKHKTQEGVTSVTFNEGSFWFMYDKDNGFSYDWLVRTQGENFTFEIIGNIYEDPELLINK